MYIVNQQMILLEDVQEVKLNQTDNTSFTFFDTVDQVVETLSGLRSS